MKTLTRVLLFAALLMIGTAANAQSLKIGYIDSNEVMNMMPERDSIEVSLMKFEQQLERELRAMATEYQSKITEAAISTLGIRQTADSTRMPIMAPCFAIF